MNESELYELAVELAKEHVCPYTKQPLTVYEINSVKNMTQFALKVIAEYERQKNQNSAIEF